MKKPFRVFFTQTKINSIHFALLSTHKGVCHIGFTDSHVRNIPEKTFGNVVTLEENTETHRSLINQISDYLAGRLHIFSVPTDIKGTTFQNTVWEAIRTIPYGETRSYQEIAKAIGKYTAARAVGQAAAANPVPLIIPCHRVMGASGKLTGFSAGLKMKAKLLSLENSFKEK